MLGTILVVLLVLFLLGARPPFELPFAFQSGLLCDVNLLIRQDHGPSRGTKRRCAPVIVFREPNIEIVGLANVERIVCAPENVRHCQTTMPSSTARRKLRESRNRLPFDSLRSLRAFSLTNGSP